ncbi:ZIP family zinc transporter [Mycolicibacterium novocastrense]|uniref:ZIP family zinc transporte n=1 Tax=Mycolicibacterium novocastrense TaxID=59813 RepID=A0AAW5SR94_MYCNV|nr:ZIP family zinc transporter [Mycolicibacterium novocastrense]MCV7025582.1 ZIP family zinc transporter [Mycolicibacterium novocastrense]GAT10602.1 ZIP family zinc transporte [Mycolicibacterium novocastrense]
MDGFALVLALAALPAAANFVGGLASELVDVSEKTLSVALHLAAGIVFAVVGIELMPEALTGTPAWIPITAFAAGGAAFIALEHGLGHIKTRLGAKGARTGPLAIFSGVSLDLFSDGVMIGTATVLNPTLGLLLALGQVAADLPEGFAAVATLRRAGIGRARRIALAASLVIPTLLGAALGYWALRDTGPSQPIRNSAEVVEFS